MEQLLDNAHGISSDKNKTSKQKQTKKPQPTTTHKKTHTQKRDMNQSIFSFFFFGSGTTEGIVEKCNGITNSKI